MKPSLTPTVTPSSHRLDKLPNEVLMRVLEEVPANSLQALGQSNRWLHALTCDRVFIRQRAAACHPRVPVTVEPTRGEWRQVMRNIVAFEVAKWAAPVPFSVVDASWINGSQEAARPTYAPDDVRGIQLPQIEVCQALRRGAGQLHNDATRQDWRRYLRAARRRPMHINEPYSMPLVRSALAIASNHAAAVVMYQDDLVKFFRYERRSLIRPPKLEKLGRMQVGDVKVLCRGRHRRVVGAIERTNHWRFRYWPAASK